MEISLQACLPKRGANPHKYQNGYAFGIAGSRSFPGAAVLSATAAAKVGAGGVRCLVPESAWGPVASHVIEIMLVSAQETKEGTLSREALAHLPTLIDKCKAGWIGCGLGRTLEMGRFIREALTHIALPLVIDADALFALDPDFIKQHSRGLWILTPHAGELERLIGGPLPPQNREAIVQECARAWNVVILLKGFPALIGDPTGGPVYQNHTGHTAATTAGCGDVLTGICAGLLAQGLSPLQAAILGMTIAGMASEAHHATYGGHTLMASDLLAQIPFVLGKLGVMDP